MGEEPGARVGIGGLRKEATVEQTDAGVTKERADKFADCDPVAGGSQRQGIGRGAGPGAGCGSEAGSAVERAIERLPAGGGPSDPSNWRVLCSKWESDQRESIWLSRL